MTERSGAKTKSTSTVVIMRALPRLSAPFSISRLALLMKVLVSSPAATLW